MNFAKKNSLRYLKLAGYCALGFFGIPIAFGFNIFTIALMLILFAKGSSFLDKYTTWGIGAEGEIKVSNKLKELEGEYGVINDLSLPDLYGNIDHLVIGPNGIFAIETKNHNGVIACNGDAWARKKVGRMGTEYEANIGNPSKQIKRNAMMLKNWIDLNCPSVDNTWVNCILTFTNDDVEVRAANRTVEILDHLAIPDYIRNFNSRNNLSYPQVNEVYQILCNSMGDEMK